MGISHGGLGCGGVVKEYGFVTTVFSDVSFSWAL